MDLPADQQDAAWLLQGTAQRYIARWNEAEDELAAALDLAIARPLPTLVTVGGVLEVSHLLDLPRRVTWKGLFMDAGLRRVEAVARAGQSQRVAAFMGLSALQGSVLEEQAFVDDYQVAAVATAKVLALAADANQPPYILTTDNADELLPTLDLPENIRADVEAAVRQGLTVTLPGKTSLQLWSGYGYRKEDPATGEAGYMLSGMLAGSMTVEEWAQGYIKDLLEAPFADPPNRDPLAAAHIVKIAASDLQNGLVGQPLKEPLAVLVTDAKGRRVVAAEVTFSILDGGGDFAGAAEQKVLSDAEGIARVKPVLGQSTSKNPIYQWVEHADANVTQVGVNLVSAAVASRYGSLAIPQPFEVYGRPQEPHHLVKLLGDGNSSIVNNPAGTVSVRVVDVYENPVSNIPVVFTVNAAKSVYEAADVHLPPGYRNLELYQAATCPGAYPLWGECPSAPSLTVPSAHYGAQVETFIGDSMATEYEVEATVEGLTPEKFALFSLGWKPSGDYSPPQIFIRHLSRINNQGEVIDAARVGEDLPGGLQAAMFMTYSDATLVSRTCGSEPNLTTCWTLVGGDLIKTRRITDGDVIFTPKTGEGSVGATENLGDGTYQAPYTTGAAPSLNVLEAVAEATVEVPLVTGRIIDGAFYEADRSAFSSGTLPMVNVLLKSGQFALFDTDGQLLGSPVKPIYYNVFGVDVPTTVEPELVMLGDGGLARQDVKFGYIIQPQGGGETGYAAQSAQLDLFTGTCEGVAQGDDKWAGYLVGKATSSVGKAVYSRGSEFDPKQQYCVQMVLNRGSSAEIRGDKVKLKTLYADLDIDSDNNAGWQQDGTHNPPSRNPLEDQIEDLPDLPGKVLRPNLADTDKDKVPGYADGINVNEQQGDGASQPFYPLKFTVEGSVVDPGAATVKFKYSGSDPALIEAKTAEDGTVSYPLPVGGGALRLWTKDGQFSRKVADFADGGDYLTPDRVYPLNLFKDVETLFVEGLRSAKDVEEKKILLVVDPDGPAGPLPEVEGDLVVATPVYAALVPDYNHDQVIDDLDRERAGLGDTYYFWINDDDDSGETGGNDIPGDTSFLGQLDCVSARVDGVRDLIDFFPVAFETKELVNTFPLSRYKYRLRAQDSQVNVLFPELATSTVGNYLVDVNTARRLSDLRTKLVPAEGKMLGIRGDQTLKTPQEELDQILNKSESDQDQPILLFEGNKKSTLPLTLDIFDESDQEVFSAQLNLSLDGVEQMFRHVNLIHSVSGYPPVNGSKWGEPDRLEEPSHCPDDACLDSDGTDFVFVHGGGVKQFV